MNGNTSLVLSEKAIWRKTDLAKMLSQAMTIGAVSLVIMGCNGGSGTDEGGQGGNPPPSDNDIVISDWHFSGGSADIAVAAKNAGYYAIASQQSLHIEIRDVRENLLHTIQSQDIINTVPDMDLSHANSLCGLTLTPSGRFLYMALCDADAGVKDDVILAYNTNTKQLSEFTRLMLQSSDVEQTQPYGMNYFKSKLYVGNHQGAYRVEAARNTVYRTTHNNHQPVITNITLGSAVQDIAVDAENQQIYLMSQDQIAKVWHTTSRPTVVHQGTDFVGLSFSSVFGEKGSEGLYLAAKDEGYTNLSYVPKRELDQMTFRPYYSSPTQWSSFSLTADGQLLFADGNASKLRDDRDQRLMFDDWLKDELSQYVRAIKGLTASNLTDNNASPEGFLHRKLESQRVNTLPIADNVGWALYLLMAADKVQPDPEIEPLIELLIKRHAGLHEDGQGGTKSVDGHFVRNYIANGETEPNNPQMQVYISMKFLPAVHKAAEMYPDNAKVAQYKTFLDQTLLRSGDVIRSHQRITWESDDFGPKRMNHRMSNETWLFGELAAAQDPRVSDLYDDYVYGRENFKYDDWLNGEPVISASHAAFIVMGAPLILEHHYSDKNWKQQNDNYYAITQAESDDLGAKYFAAFSAGNNPDKGGYYNDGPSDHPGNFIHFPAVLGFGQMGHSAAVLGGYKAYRDNRRQTMKSAGDDQISLLTRWSKDNTGYEMSGIGIADFWFGSIGLVETIQPGVMGQFRNEFFYPELREELTSDGRILHFSKLTPRLIEGVKNNGEVRSFGYQTSPFVVPGNDTFSSFNVIDPLGDWVELNDIVSILTDKPARFENPNFDTGTLQGWQPSGNVAIIDGELGPSAKLSGSASLSQGAYLPLGLAGSGYQVSAYVAPLSGSSGSGYVQLTWSSSPNTKGDVLAGRSEKVLSGEQPRLVTVMTNQPAGHAYLHIEFVTESGEFAFDNTALQSFGAQDVGFSIEDAAWSLSGVTQSDGRLQFSASQGSNGWVSATTEYDISADDDGTRYLFSFDANERQIHDGEFVISAVIKTDSGAEVKWEEVMSVSDESSDNLSFAMRKRPGEIGFELQFKMRANEQNSRMSVENLSVAKELLFDIGQCSGSITGC
ncbi:hypothetical protein [Vibrio celticus]|uniref:Uncharacterized protein n=1 Tax=Vibrio celticus TaxID=446372 RepID=A0A1C3J8G5_9VIBR|nr:hypothetical protein [Vibrio celticus]SBT11327.1 hypothetical protein VCE7224_00043 [Vibrio celticus]